MASITIRNLDEDLKQRLRVRAAEHGRSMEAEVRAILRKAVAAEPMRSGGDLARKIHERFADIGGVELELPKRDLGREPPDFS